MIPISLPAKPVIGFLTSNSLSQQSTFVPSCQAMQSNSSNHNMFARNLLFTTLLRLVQTCYRIILKAPYSRTVWIHSWVKYLQTLSRLAYEITALLCLLLALLLFLLLLLVFAVFVPFSVTWRTEPVHFTRVIYDANTGPKGDIKTFM